MMDRKEYIRNYQRAWIAKRRASFFADKCCATCKSIECLELHHINPEEKEANSIWSWSKERRDIEIAKCIVLCNNCHKKETKLYLQQLFSKHGTPGQYYDGGCRCKECTLAAKIDGTRRKMVNGVRKWVMTFEDAKQIYFLNNTGE